MSGLGFLPDLLILSATFALIIKFRKEIARLFLKIPGPRFFVYVASSIPFIIFEENINCLPTGCQLIPWTVPVLIVLVIILGLICRRLKAHDLRKTTFFFSLYGVFWELIIGGLAGALGLGLFFIFMVFWVLLSYAYLVVVPLTILFSQEIGEK
ncbi:MAG: hypothetical protein NUV67_04065 [archaeon]|nr:hypothetical protein [archaeon]